jgi:hypothetical protein
MKNRRRTSKKRTYKKRTPKKRTYKKRTPKKRTYKKRTPKKRTYKKRTPKKRTYKKRMKGGAHTPEESAILLQARLRESGRFDRLADREKAQDILAKSEDRYSPHEIEKIETELAEHGLSFNKGTIESPAGLEIRKRIDDAKEQVATKERRERSQKADAWKELVNTDDWVSGDPTVFEQDNVLPHRTDLLRHLGEISLPVRGPVNFGGSSQGRGPNKSDVTFDTLWGPSKVSDGRGGWTWSPEVIPRISLINLIYAMHNEKPPTGSDQQPYPKDIAGVTQIVGKGVLLSRGDEILSLLDQWIYLLNSGENVPIWADRAPLTKSGLEKCQTLRLLLKRIIRGVKSPSELKAAREKEKEIKEKEAQLEIEREAERAREAEEKTRQEKESADAFNEAFDRRARLRAEEKLAADQAKKEALRVKEEERIALREFLKEKATEDARVLQVAWKLKKETDAREYAEKKKQEKEEEARLKELEDAKEEAHKKWYDSDEEVAKRNAANLLIRQQEAEEAAKKAALQKQIDEDDKVRLNKEEAVRLEGVAREHYDQGLIQEEQSQKAGDVEAASLVKKSKENFKEAVKTLNEARAKDNTNKDVMDLLALAIVKSPPVSSFKGVFDSDSDSDD